MPKSSKVGRGNSGIVGTTPRGKARTGLNPKTSGSYEPPLGHVAFSSLDLDLYVPVLLNGGGFRLLGGGPKPHDVIERVKDTGVAEYRGHDPYRISVSVLLDGYPERTSVKPTIELLHRFAEKLRVEDRMPVIKLHGSIPYYKDLRWLVDGPIEWDDDPRPIKIDNVLYRQALTVTMIERVRQTVLTDSISRGRRQGKGAKKTPLVYVNKRGETTLQEISKAVYGNRRRAHDIALFNNIPVGSYIAPGSRTRIP